MALKNIIKAVPLTTFNSTGLSGTYQAINAGGLPSSCFLIRITNGSGVPITISYDGTTDGDWLASNGTLQLNGQTNADPQSGIANWPIGTKIFVKGTASTGLIYLSAYYQPPV